MAKKFGKVLLFATAVAAAGAGIYYYLNKEKFSPEYNGEEDDDYDDFGNESDKEDNSRSYVALNHENAPAEDKEEAPVKEEATADAPAEEKEAADEAPKAEEPAEKEDAPFEELSSVVEDVTEKADEKIDEVEEFFDEDDEKNE